MITRTWRACAARRVMHITPLPPNRPAVDPVVPDTRLRKGRAMGTDNVASIAMKVLVAGVLIFGFGLFGMLSTPSDPYAVICDGQQMTHGDRCISNRSSNSGTYEELVQRNIESAKAGKTEKPLIMIVGGLLVLGAIGTLVARSSTATGAARTERPADSRWWVEKDEN
jgi:hypothetical protein